MAYKKDNETDWVSKEKRELFCKSINSMIMTDPKKPLEVVLNDAKTIVDTAFENYPDTKNKSNAKQLDF